MGGYTWFTGDGPPEPPEQQEDENVSEPKNSCGEPARKGQFGPLDQARVDLAAKDAEIAELRHRASNAELQRDLLQKQSATFLAERDEAREEVASYKACVGRLFPFVAAQLEFEERMRFSCHTEKVGRAREARITELRAAVDGTPEHLRP